MLAVGLGLVLIGIIGFTILFMLGALVVLFIGTPLRKIISIFAFCISFGFVIICIFAFDALLTY